MKIVVYSHTIFKHNNNMNNDIFNGRVDFSNNIRKSIKTKKNKIEEANNLSYELVRPTIFPIYSEKEHKVINATEVLGTTYQIVKDSLIRREQFAQIGLTIFDIECECTKACRQIIRYIVKTIKYNSNAISLQYSKVIEFGNIDKGDFFNAIKYLTDSNSYHKLLAYTTKQSLFVVDHNLIFKGSMELFIKTYLDNYSEGISIDEKGRIIIIDPSKVK